MKRLMLPVLVLLALVLLGGCVEPEYRIVATTAPVQQFAEAVCEGTGLEIGLVIQDSVSCIHDYTLSTRQMIKIEHADLVLLSGCNLESFLGDALEAGKAQVTCSDGIPLLEEDGEPDPHIWLSPANAQLMVRNIAAGLSEYYPEYADTFAANADAYCEELQRLQEQCSEELEGLTCRKLMTFHDGFAYFADCFDLEIAAVIEEEEGSEASARELQEMIAIVRENGLPAVFVEKNGSRSAASVISEETGCAVGVLDMGLSDTDYFDMIRANTAAVKEALQ